MRKAWREIDPVWPQSLGACRANVVLAQHFEQRRAGDTRDQPGRVAAQHQRRQDQMGDCVAEDVPLACQEGIDGEETGHVGRRRHARIEPPGSCRPAQLGIENVERQQRQPEDREADAQERYDTRNVIEPTIAHQRRGQPQDQPNGRAE